MSIIIDRIAKYLDEKGISVRSFEMAIGASNGAIGRAIKDNKDIQSKWISIIIEKYSDLNPVWLLKGEGEMIIDSRYSFQERVNTVNEPESPYPYIITVDPQGNENIAFVNVKARAGYLSGYGDPEYLSELPVYRLPGFNNGTFRAFEVQGDSMYQFQTRSGLTPGDWIISERVEHPFQIKDTRVYVIICDEGVIVKRCINRLSSESKVLICQSDNKSGEYADILLHLENIMEVWEFKASISRHIPPPSDVYKSVLDLQADVAILKHKLNHLSK
ncbi:MAG: S24 family peptidase [Marinoscillum sp.]|uniref:S24 family peptidase n=1 Tax=Marinoscillum sp. TaxID=2024838 RepID=UPI0032F1D88E